MESKLNAEYDRCKPTDVDKFEIFLLPVNGINYGVDIVFTKEFGLTAVILRNDDRDPATFKTALAELKDRYGDATPTPTDNGVEWEWVKPHGNLTLDVYRSGDFDIFYSRRKGKNAL